MTVRLFDTDHDIIASAVGVLGFADRQADRFALIVAVTDHPSVMVCHVPTIQLFVVVDMKGMVRTRLHGLFAHD
jgi:hypothetical protein